MKHPFQIVLSDQDGHVFTSVKNEILVFNTDGQRIGHWIDPLDKSVTLKKQQEEKIKQLSEKKLKTNDETPIKIPKIPVPGLGAPPLYNYIRSLSVRNDILVGTTDSDKAVVIFRIDFSNNTGNCLCLIKRQVLPKRPCAVSQNDKVVVVADKFGDVYTVSIDLNEPVEDKALAPILGHVSMLSDVLITTRDDGKSFILTADRDEHIRVTNYPKSYVIKSWLFGHREFILSLVIPEFNRDLLISGGGDNYVLLWNWYDNKLLDQVDIRTLIEPFLNDSHLPPERFLTEDSVKEVTVSNIISYAEYFYVVCENTKCINGFKIDAGDGFKVNHIQTLTTQHSIVDITLDKLKNQLIACFDTEDEHKLLAGFAIADGGLLQQQEQSKALTNISDANECLVESRDDFYPLYYTSTLRKRSDH